MSNSKMIRLDKALSDLTGLSRNDSRKAIFKGQVSLDGKIIDKPDYKADFEGVKIEINGQEYVYEQFVYIMMNKPQNCVCTNADDELSVLNTLPNDLFRRDLFTVGRLDKDTTGLLIITNDGDFAHKVISPKKHIIKRYEATLDAPLDEKSVNMLKSGVTLKDGDNVKAISVDILSEDRKKAAIEIDSGKYHQVKRMFASVGCSVMQLHRTKIGALKLCPSLEIGQAKKINLFEAENCFR